MSADSFASDLNVARYFLSNIDEEVASECRAVWLGGKTRPRPTDYPKSVTFSSDQENVLERLDELNSQGYDIFCLPSRVDTARLESGKPARNCDVTGTYWVGVDIDTTPTGVLSNLGYLQECGFEPTIIVQTSQPHRLQAFWQIDKLLSPDDATTVNKALAKKFGGDPQSTNAARLFRLPGYLHRKGKQDAVQSQIVGGTNYGYNTAEIKRWAGVDKARATEAKNPLKPGSITSVSDTPNSVLDAPADDALKRLNEMRQRHARERAADRKTSPVKRVRSANPQLPDTVAVPLRNTETLGEFIQALESVYPRQAGCRHFLTLAVGVELFKYACSLEKALGVVQRVCKLARDEETSDRLQAVRGAYRAAQQGKRVTGLGSGASMTVFSAEHFGPDLRTLPPPERTAERRRRVLAALETIRETDAGVRECSCRTLAERTGVTKDAVSRTLRELQSEGVIKRVRLGVMVNKAEDTQKPAEAPEPNTPNIDSPTPYRAPQAQPKRLYAPSAKAEHVQGESSNIPSEQGEIR